MHKIVKFLSFSNSKISIVNKILARDLKDFFILFKFKKHPNISGIQVVQVLGAFETVHHFENI